MRILTLSLLVLVVSGCGSSVPAGNETAQLHRLFDEEWEFRLAEDPLFATSQGRHEYDDRLPSVSRTDEERRTGVWRRTLERLQAIDRSGLGFDDQISYDVFQRLLRERIESFELGAYRLPLTVDSGFHTDFARLASDVPLATVDDYDHYLARLRAFPAYVDQHVGLLRDGIEHGMTLPRVVLEGYEVTIASHVVDDPAASVFWPPFENLPETFSEDQRRRLLQDGEAAIRDAVVPGYRKFLDFMLGEYVPAARTTLGASELPGGDEYYAHLIRHFTTLDDLGADDIHQIGLREVARIKAEESEAGLQKIETYRNFSRRAAAVGRDLRDFLTSAKSAGKTVAGYGAPAKGNTLLNYCGIGPELLPYTVDVSPHKQGRLLPGSHIPVEHPDVIAERKPDYVLILPWNLKDEIVSDMAHVREWGGKFVVPIPDVKVLP